MSGAEESGPLPRTSGPAKDFVRGSINNRPFRPGGLDDSQGLDRTLPEGASNGEWVREVLNGGPAQAIPPSLKQGLNLGALKVFFFFYHFVILGNSMVIFYSLFKLLFFFPIKIYPNICQFELKFDVFIFYLI